MRTAQLPLRDRAGRVRARATVDAADVGWLAAYRWSLHSAGYAQRGTERDGKARCVLLHREVLGLAHGDGVHVDHLNGDRLDCRRSNLRMVTQAQNNQNRPATDFRGAYRVPSGRWQARAQLARKTHYLGTFDTRGEAADTAAAWRAANMPYAAR